MDKGKQIYGPPELVSVDSRFENGVEYLCVIATGKGLLLILFSSGQGTADQCCDIEWGSVWGGI